MTIPEILTDLEPYTGRFPKKAMQAAIEQREAITPELLRVVETVAEDPVKHAERRGYALHLFAIYLLAQFRENRAYPLFVKIFSAPGETAFDLVGDTVTERLGRILASVYDGNPAPLQSLVESEEVNEYVRDAGIDAFLALEHSGQMSREEVMEYFRKLFGGKLKRSHSHVWNGLVCAVADLPAPELLEDVRRAYADGLVDSGFARLEGIDRDLRAPNPRRRARHHIITDAIAEMEWWASFHPRDSRPAKLSPLPPRALAALSKILDQPAPPAPPAQPKPSPAVPRQPKIGRNDPCPCGSSKKYKKCCGKG